MIMSVIVCKFNALRRDRIAALMVFVLPIVFFSIFSSLPFSPFAFRRVPASTAGVASTEAPTSPTNPREPQGVGVARCGTIRVWFIQARLCCCLCFQAGPSPL